MAETREAALASRRSFLKGAAVAGTGLIIGFDWFGSSRLAAQSAETTTFAPNAFVRIGEDDLVTVMLKHIEFGQGVATGLSTIVAEELGADWSQMRFEHAPSDVTRYANFAFGAQGTGGSTAIANSWQQLRVAGATARAMLVAAAAEQWGVAAAEITVAEGEVRHRASGRTSRFGALVGKASSLPVPENPPLRDPKAFRLIGSRVPKLDSAAKSNGSARFTQDVYMEDMSTAVVAHPPRFGGTVASFDASAAEKVPGVSRVVAIPEGVAVLAESYWAAKKGRDALVIEWDESGAETRGTAELEEEYRRLADQPGAEVVNRGDADGAFAAASKVLEAEYVFPFLAHAPMETLDFVIQLEADRCRAWAGSQIQTVDQMALAEVTGLTPDKVELTTLLGGGSFGRRATPTGELAREAAHIAKAVANGKPIKLIRTREDDIRGGYYRPFYLHRLKAGLDDTGRLVAWQHRVVGQSIMSGTPFEAVLVQDGIDQSSIEGGSNLPYAIENFVFDLHSPGVGVPVLWWRSVGHTHNGYSTEAFLDQVASAAGRDPYELRRELLADHPRHLGVLDLAAKKAGWGDSLPEGRARGIALQESFGSFAAQVAEVSVDENGMPKVHRVVCAIDCGIAINPDIIAAQMESGIGYGLNAALFGEVEMDAGRVVQSNFHDYRPLRIHEMPEVEVHIVASNEAPTGVGEPGVPPIAPAVANAYFALTGQPIHRLPFRRSVGGATEAGEERS